MPSSDRAWVLDEDEALELLAYLLNAARAGRRGCGVGRCGC